MRFRAYITDALQITGANTARYAGGSELTVRFAELAYDFKPADERTADDIKEGIVAKLRALEG